MPVRYASSSCWAGGALHNLHQVGRDTYSQLTGADHHHVGHSGGERKHQTERGTLTFLGAGFDASAQCLNFGSHDIHADTATGQLSDFGRRR